MKETFIVRTEWFDAIKELEPIDQATIFQNLFHFHNGEENLINLNNLSVKLVWRFIEPNLKRNINVYDKRKETSSENGKLGGRPKKEEKQEEKNLNNLNKPNESLSVLVPVLDLVPDYSKNDDKGENFEISKNDSEPVPDFVSANRKKITPLVGGGRLDQKSLKSDLMENEYCNMQASRDGILKGEYEFAVDFFIEQKFGLGENEKWKDLADARRNFTNWIPYYITNNQKANEGFSNLTVVKGGYGEQKPDNRNSKAAF